MFWTPAWWSWDYWQARRKTTNGETCALVLVNDRTRKPWTILLKRKSDAFEENKAWATKVERQTGRRVRNFQSDGGREFISDPMRRWLAVKGFKRMIGTLKTTLRSSAPPPSYWSRALLYATWCHARTATSSHSAFDTVTRAEALSPTRQLPVTRAEPFDKERSDVFFARKCGQRGGYTSRARTARGSLDGVKALDGRFIGPQRQVVGQAGGRGRECRRGRVSRRRWPAHT